MFAPVTKMLNTFDPMLNVIATYLSSVVSAKESTPYAKIVKYREYCDGTQAEALTDVQKSLLAADGMSFTLNICYTIVNLICDRLKVRNVAVEVRDEPEPADGEQSLSDTLQDAINKVWQQNRMDEVTREIHEGASRDGESFVITEYDPDKRRVMITINDAYDGQTGTYAVYDPDGRTPKYFVKIWKVKPAPAAKDQTVYYRMNIYHPDRVEKWISKSASTASWEPLDPASLTEIITADGIYKATIAEWKDTSGKPLGFPVFHFRANTARGAGRSDLADIVPDVQDNINVAYSMIYAASQLQGTPLLLIFSDAPLGELKLFPGSPVQIPSSKGVAGSAMTVPAADITQLSDNLDNQIRRAALIANVPTTQLTTSAQVAAEGTQQQNEVLFLAKVKRRQVNFGNSYEDIARMVLKMLIAFDPTFTALTSIDAVDDLIVSCIWEPAEIRNEMNDVTRAAMLLEKLQVSPELAQQIAGLSEDEIKAETKRRLKQQLTETINNLRAAQTNAADQLAQVGQQLTAMETANNASAA